jgi:hypothetical protein
LLLCGLLLSTQAFAWVEMHVIAHETRVELSRQGQARVEHLVRMRIGGGPFRSFDIKLADRAIVLEPDAWIAPAREGAAAGLTIPVAVQQRPDGAVRADIDGKKGVSRGVYELRFAYTLDLLRDERVSRDGSMLRVSWVGPRWDDGIDTVKCTFLVPAAPTEPRVAPDTRIDLGNGETAYASAGTFLTALVRGSAADELTLVRPHVAKGESVAWAMLVDPRALSGLGGPSLRGASAAEVRAPTSARDRSAVLAAGAVVAMLFGLVLALKHRAVAACCRACGVEARPLVPVRVAVRVALAGPGLAAGLAAQALLEDPLPGSIGVLCAALLSVYRPPLWSGAPRGPGRWLPLNERDALRAEPWGGSAWLDASTTRGKMAMACALALLGAGVALVARISPYHAHLAAFDSVVVFALFGTGTRRSMPGDLVRASGAYLREVAARLRDEGGEGGVRVSAMARIPRGAAEPDEVRLRAKVRSSAAGLVALEIGVGWYQGIGGRLAAPQVLLRVAEGSACDAQLGAAIKRARWMRGRDAHERVVALSPTLPTVESTCALVRQAVELLERGRAGAHIGEPSCVATSRGPIRARVAAGAVAGG